MDDAWITVWLPINNPFLQEDGLSCYADFVRVVASQLQVEGLGYFEGAMTGAKDVNLSFTLDPAGDAERAIALVIDALKRCGHERDAIAAHAGFVTRDGQPSRFENAVWPPGFAGILPR